MGRILIVDDAPFWRDVTADALRLKGHSVLTAEDGQRGLEKLLKEGADLVILDVEMPRVEGFSFLKTVRRHADWQALPVIMLTGESHKEQIIRAKELGAVDYLLKARFSLSELVDRVEKRLLSRNGAEPALAAVEIVRPKPTEIPSLLTREQSIERAESAMQGRTLSGIVLQVIATAGSPRVDLSDLSTLIGHDALLAARVLQASNSVAYTSKRGVISTLSEAVRVIGSSTIRDLAVSFGVFDAMPVPAFDGFNPIRCWQHSIAVASLCNRLAPEAIRPRAYLVGLCHDLGEVLFRSHFGPEYEQVLEFEKSTGKPRLELERVMLGMTQAELAQLILKKLTLPETIEGPITAFHSASVSGAVPTDPMAKLLNIAENISGAMMLSTSEHALVRPLNRPECRSAIGTEDPPRFSGSELRSEVVVLTSQYARLKAKEMKQLAVPRYERKPVRVWIARDASFSTFDPIAVAMESLAEVVIETRLPTAEERKDVRGLLVVARNESSAGLTPAEVSKLCSTGEPLPVLYLAAHADGQPHSPLAASMRSWPVEMKVLADFVQRLS